MFGSEEGEGIDICSLVPIYCEAHFKDIRVGTATAFPWRSPTGRLMLVTNWHVVSGRNNETGRVIHAMGAVPDRLEIHLPQSERLSAPTIVTSPLTQADGQPAWFDHPVSGSAIDVAALPFPEHPFDARAILAINDLPWLALKRRIGMPLFILGYPFGRTGAGFPVWKKGTFASEPYLSPSRTMPFLTVDSASRPGMSGSPVIMRVHGEIELSDGDRGHVQNGDGGMDFVGIYSGRFHTKDDNDAQLARVWPREYIEDIVIHAEKRM